jgi:hypothetical protein
MSIIKNQDPLLAMTKIIKLKDITIINKVEDFKNMNLFQTKIDKTQL